jgi:hypothetical protein
MGIPDYVALFPLPEHVFLPDTPSGYRVFEPRYVQLIEDLLALDEGRRWIAIPKLAEGWQKDYEGSPDFHAVATIGLVEEIVREDDGSFQIVVHGLHRARLVEQPSGRLYRLANVFPWPEDDASDAEEIAQRYGTVLQILSSLQIYLEEAAQIVGDALRDTSDLSATVFRLAAVFIQGTDRRQRLLEARSLAVRLRILEDALAVILATASLMIHRDEETETLPS